MCGHLCDQVIVNIHAVGLGLAGSDDKLEQTCARE
jgi:hypothetical protein